MAMHITKDNFDKEVLQSPNRVLIDFYADWCAPCRMLAPVIDDISKEVPDVKICKVNIDEQPELAQRFRIMSIPTLVVVEDGKIIHSALGVQPKQHILDMLAG
ncbi:MAG: thioredoxin [Christensenellales bacterium]|jgi:thioredoxin 1